MPGALHQPDRNHYLTSGDLHLESTYQLQPTLYDPYAAQQEQHHHHQHQPPESLRSPILLPSSTYQAHSLHSRAAPQSTSNNHNNLSRLDTSVGSPGHHPDPTSSANPDDFYKDYTHPSEFPQNGAVLAAGSATSIASASGSGASLHQDAIRSLSITSIKSDSPSPSPSPSLNPGLKSRKASVKNLVAQINASALTEAPPIPTQQLASNLPIRNPSGYLPSSHISSFASPAGSRKNSSSGLPPAPSSRRTSHSTQRRPLFGEILPFQPTFQSAGFGIANPRRHTASESVPVSYTEDSFSGQFPQSAAHSSLLESDRHRRSNSDMTVPHSSSAISPVASRRPPITSRIPVKSRRASSASDSGSSTPNSRANSAADRTRRHHELARATSKTPDPSRSLRPEPTTPGRITSPGRRGKTPTPQHPPLPSGAKSPSLRANIIAPPPKDSPPLRSSRPRLPVSSASTAASRARMAEKFNTLQKLNSERKSAQSRRPKPPELTDIDLNARRLRITQALTRSRDSEDLRSRVQTGRRWEPASRDSSPRPDSSVLPLTDLPPSSSHLSNHLSRTSRSTLDADHQYATTDALDVLTQGDSHHSHDEEEENVSFDSGHRPAVHVQTQFLTQSGNSTEPMSAVTDVTVATEATHIDPEPQDENAVDVPSMINDAGQVESPLTHTENPGHDSDLRDDRADVESVNLIFRNTAYLDDEEAIKRGYRTNFGMPEAVPEEAEGEHDNTRDSWASSIHDGDDDVDGNERYASDPHLSQHQLPHTTANLALSQEHDDSYRNTMASDAYTMINIVLQEHSNSDDIDQDLADEVYRKFLTTRSEEQYENSYDPRQIEELCRQEIERQMDPQSASSQGKDARPETEHVTTLLEDRSPIRHSLPRSQPAPPVELPAGEAGLLTLPSTRFEGHRHKPSLDSAEDWASTSPSVGDWMRFAADGVSPPAEENAHRRLSDANIEVQTNSKLLNDDTADNNGLATEPPHRLAPVDPDEETLGPEDYGIAIIRAPTNTPPPPPKDTPPGTAKSQRFNINSHATENGPRQPHVPQRLTSTGQVTSSRTSLTHSRPGSVRSQSRAEITPWEVQDHIDDMPDPEFARLTKRRHVIKELVDTEYTYQRDMRVLCDIYKQTATAALSEDDIRILFGNVEQVQGFARDFLTALKQTTKATERKKDKRDAATASNQTVSTASTLVSSKTPLDETDMENDRETRIGEAFEGSLHDMENVYTEYIRNQHAANLRLEVLSKSPAAQEWLKECRDNSSDITNAWNLDALLVKPVQRITKYPLLLKELVDATAADHPDLPTLKSAMNNVTEINMRINDLKRHADALDQALVRKRGQSDVRTGLTKAFGRRAERLRQHVGIADMYEDSEYDKIRIGYDNNYVQLMVVANDCQNYEKGMTQWVDKMVQVAAAAEGWVDVGHSNHQQEESKLRHLAMIIKNVHNIALPDHLEHLQKKVIKPMLATVEMLTKFKDDPKGLLHKRDKRLIDYAQMKNKKDKGERLDKKSLERMDQWEALNTEAKERMRKLLRATAHLVQTCQGHLVQLQMTWMALIQQKFSSVMGINNNRLSPEDIEKDWQIDFDFQEASALALNICNGALMLQAANMTSFLTPGSATLNGDDSPRQMSFASGGNTKRSVSLHSESSTVPTLELGSRPSGTYSTQALPESHFDRPYPYPNGRTRAASTTSGKSQQKPEAPSRGSVGTNKHTSASASFARPGTSPMMPQDVFAPPRLSVDTYSPLMSSFPSHISQDRPVSSNTFFSAAPGPSAYPSQNRTRGSGVFSSALPMSDSPVHERLSHEGLFNEPQVLFTAASVYEFNIDRARRDAGFPYLTYVTGEIFDVIGERGELWLARNQDDPQKQVGWIWNKHFAKLAE